MNERILIFINICKCYLYQKLNYATRLIIYLDKNNCMREREKILYIRVKKA